MKKEKLKKIEEVKSQIKCIKETIWRLEESRDFKSVYEDFFNEILTDDFTMDGQSDGRNIQFKMYDKSVDRHREVFSIYFPWSLDVESNEFELSYYTSSCRNTFEFQRLVMLGKVAEFISDDINKGKLMELYRVTKSLHKDEIQILNRERWILEKTINDLYIEIREIDKQIKLDELSKDGITYANPTTIYVRPNQSLRNIKSIKLVKYTTSSKKTATFEFKDRNNDVIIRDKVKVKNIIEQI